MHKHTPNWAIALVIIFAAALPTHLAARPNRQTSPAAVPPLYFPLVQGSPSLAGVFDCNETEFGLGWATEVITLTNDGSSVYEYLGPNHDIVAGSWVYTPTTSIVELRNFRWLTATVDFPNSFFNSRYIPSGNFDVTISCSRR